MENPPEIREKPIQEIISGQLDIKLRPFIGEELDVVLKKIKNRRAVDFDKIPAEVWKKRKFDSIFHWLFTVAYKSKNKNGQKGASFPFPIKGTSELLKTTEAWISSSSP